ncbi:hypothetical protein DFR68_10888 [Nocardia mexicana]|uniref:Uncharacterized protein n=2 Tax=Nocardia mexicana TaxID=279262 RepID=A0A370GXP6_9NOCA|nr:hypothetical protein DFR68_10888 [Nocardia mexicana]
MSQHPATHRRTAQIFQHTAIVFAGMASIGLTVAAGTYIVNQIADSTHRPAPGPAVPVAAPPAGSVESVSPESPSGPATIGLVGLKAESRALPPLAPVPGPPAPIQLLDRAVVPTAPAQTTVTPTGMNGRLPLLGGTYVGANVATTQPDSVSMTVDTNVFATLVQRPGDLPGGTRDDVTRFRTDLDTRHGEVTVAVSDPVLGQHDVQLQRHARPAPVQQPDSHGHKVIPVDTDPGTAPDTPAVTEGEIPADTTVGVSGRPAAA